MGIRYERPQLGASHRKTRLDFGLSEGNHLYACPQTLFKFHPEFDDILKNILEADPLAELVLLEGRLPEWTHRLRRRFRRTLPDADRRVRFLPALPRNVFLQLLAISDVVLDPIHFGSGNSSMEALAMGVPLVTLEGSFLRSRITSAMYREIGLTELIATDHADYSRLAVRLACEPDFRRSVCQALSERGERFFENRNAAREIEDCLIRSGAYVVNN